MGDVLRDRDANQRAFAAVRESEQPGERVVNERTEAVIQNRLIVGRQVAGLTQWQLVSPGGSTAAEVVPGGAVNQLGQPAYHQGPGRNFNQLELCAVLALP